MVRGLFVFLCLMLLSASAGSEQNVNPDINRHYEDADAARWRGVFEREGREVWDQRNEIIRHLRLQPGQTAADIGAGSGFFTLLMAQQVGPTGRVYAVDITENFVGAIVHRAREQELSNVVGVVNSQHSAQLPVNSIDLAFISDTYHHFEYPRSMLRSIHSALKPGGHMVIIDFRRAPESSSSWVLGHVRADVRQVIKEVEASGFEVTEELDFMQTQYYLRFRKK